MPPEEKDRSRYYQEIAAAFLKRRGGPFLMSSKDLALIASWEAQGIPLDTVLEGIEKAFDYYRNAAPVKRAVRTLAACGPQVLKAFERRRDRAVGGAVKVAPRREKRERIAGEVRRFLAAVPDPVSFLRAPFEEALTLVDREEPDEEALERLEAGVEKLLAENAAAGERDSARRDVAREFPKLAASQAEEAVRLKLLKSLREKYRVPFITFPYY